MWFHVTDKDYGPAVKFSPRVPTDKLPPWEDKTTPRICFSPSIEKALMGCMGVGCPIEGVHDLSYYSKREGHRRTSHHHPYVYVYAISDRHDVVTPTKAQVRDVETSGEVWRVRPTTLRKFGRIDVMRSLAEKVVVVD
ncbi:hypothetical protein [Burkholderia phage BCSR5]|nr:hypothetical protein [Burkholderia phage BCSR5]